MDQNVSKEILPVCKHHQTSYCKYGDQCHNYQNNTTCKERVCRDSTCRERHPKTCKYYTNNNTCSRKEKCAYSHSKNEINNKIPQLEIEVVKLKESIIELSNNMSVIMAKLMTLEISEEHVDHPTEQLNINQEAPKQQDELECDVQLLNSRISHFS